MQSGSAIVSFSIAFFHKVFRAWLLIVTNQNDWPVQLGPATKRQRIGVWCECPAGNATMMLRWRDLSVPAAPVHQVQEYYRFGQVDDCMGHWSKLWGCLKQRTKFAEEVSPPCCSQDFSTIQDGACKIRHAHRQRGPCTAVCPLIF